MRSLVRSVIVVLIGAVILTACRPNAVPPTATPLPPTFTPSAIPTRVPTRTPIPQPTTTPGIVPQTIADNPSQQVYLRFVHAAPDTQPVDIYIELLSVATNLAFGGSTDPTGIVAGSYHLVVVPAGSRPDDKPLLSIPLVVKGGQSLILLFTGTPDALKILTFLESQDSLDAGQSRVSVINAVPGSPNIILREGNADISTAVGFGQMSNAALLPVGDKVLIFLNGAAVLNSLSLKMRERHSYTLVVVGRSADLNNLSVITFDTRVAGRSQVRAINASLAIDSIDVYLNDQMIGKGLTFSHSSDRQPVLSGTYTLSIYEAGADRSTVQPLVSLQVITNPGDVLALILVGQSEDWRVVTYREDLSPTSPTQARIVFVNTLYTVPLARIEMITGAIADFPDINYADVSPALTLDAGTYGFFWHKIVNNAKVEPIENAPDVVLEPGRSYLYLLSGRMDGNPPYILTENVGTDQKLATPSPDEATVTPNIPTRIRFINSTSNAQLIDLLVDDKVVSSGLSFAQGTDWLNLDSGSHVITVHPTGADTLVGRYQHQFDIPGDYTMVAFGSTSTRVELLLASDAKLVFDDQSPHVRLINTTQDTASQFTLAYGVPLPTSPVNEVKPGELIQSLSPDAPTFRSTIPVGLTQIIANVNQGTAADSSARTPTGAYDLIVIDDMTHSIAATLPGVDLKAGVHYDVIAFQEFGSVRVRAFILAYPGTQSGQ